MFIRHLALLNPIQFIANTTIKFLIKRFDVNTVAFTLINVLYQTAKSLISSVGIFPTLRILRDIRKFLSTYDGKIDQSYFELINFLNPPSAHTTPFTTPFSRESGTTSALSTPAATRAPGRYRGPGTPESREKGTPVGRH